MSSIKTFRVGLGIIGGWTVGKRVYCTSFFVSALRIANNHEPDTLALTSATSKNEALRL
jgi:hypothetical protein